MRLITASITPHLPLPSRDFETPPNPPNRPPSSAVIDCAPSDVNRARERERGRSSERKREREREGEREVGSRQSLEEPEIEESETSFYRKSASRERGVGRVVRIEGRRVEGREKTRARTRPSEGDKGTVSRPRRKNKSNSLLLHLLEIVSFYRARSRTIRVILLYFFPLFYKKKKNL